MSAALPSQVPVPAPLVPAAASAAAALSTRRPDPAIFFNFAYLNDMSEEDYVKHSIPYINEERRKFRLEPGLSSPSQEGMNSQEEAIAKAHAKLQWRTREDPQWWKAFLGVGRPSQHYPVPTHPAAKSSVASVAASSFVAAPAAAASSVVAAPAAASASVAAAPVEVQADGLRRVRAILDSKQKLTTQQQKQFVADITVSQPAGDI